MDSKDKFTPPIQESGSGDPPASEQDYTAENHEQSWAQFDFNQQAEENVYTNYQQETIHNAGDPPKSSAFDLIYGVLFDPIRTWAKVAAHPPVAIAAIIFITISLLEGLASIFMAPLYESFSFGGGFSFAQAMQPFLFVGSFTLSVIMWFFMSGFLHLIAELFGGQGQAKGVFTVYALANLPAVLIIPLNIIVALIFTGRLSVVLTNLFIFVAFIWSVVLVILGISQVHRLSASKATIVVIAPALVIFAWIMVALLILLTAVPAVAPMGPYFKIF